MEIHMFCASQVANSTLVGNVEEGSSSSLSSSCLQFSSSPAIDRYNPIIRDPRRLGNTLASCTSPHHHKQSTSDYLASEISNEVKKKQQQKPTTKPGSRDEKRKSSGDRDNADANGGGSIMSGRRSWSCMKPGGYISPPGSSRYLLSEKAFLNVLSDFDPLLKLVPPGASKSHAVRIDESGVSLQSAPAHAPAPDQVVVLRVSLHCRGCERKMRKHISRMEGVSSFNIDFAAKKVTVVGNVTPLGVLASISKVKTAQLWTSPVSPISQSYSEIKKPEPTLI